MRFWILDSRFSIGRCRAGGENGGNGEMVEMVEKSDARKGGGLVGGWCW